MKSTIILFITCFLVYQGQAQVAKTQVLQINAEPQSDGIQLEWKSRSFTGNYLIYRRTDLTSSSWDNTPIATLSSTATSYKDNSITIGKSAEYRIIPVNSSNQAVAFGYIYAGNQKSASLENKGVILLIDSTFITSLSSEINRLVNDLELEDWSVTRLYAGRNEAIPAIKDKIKAAYDNDKSISTLFILGHVPVPYSGDFSAASNFPPPDGHVEGSGNHTGAWCTDAYYGDLEGGSWTDLTVDRTTGSRTRNHNIVGDGKFDQSRIPSDLELEVGRVDLFDMPAFAKNETELLRDYLNRNHRWRTQEWQVRQRALVDNNFGGLNLASTGYHNFSTFFDLDSIQDADYFTEQQSGSYLWSYGCGAGSYTSCNGIGTTNTFASTPLQNVFTILAGSYFGDWDITNNLLRAPLANSALVSFWGGIPKWYVHTMGLGKHVGFGTRVSANNNNLYFNGAFNNSFRLITIALMGDPTLKNSHLPQVNQLSAVSANNKVDLRWTQALGDFTGYNIYRINKSDGKVFQVNTSPVTDTFFTDAINWYSGTYTYSVRATRLEETGSGSYHNIGGGVRTDVNHVNSSSNLELTPLTIYPNPSENGLFFLNSSINDNSQVLVTNINGQEVSFDIYDKSLQINSGTGIYFVKISNNESTQTFKLIIHD